MQTREINSVILGDSLNPVVLILHGWGHSIEMTRGLGELLSGSFCVHLLDLPGHGKSPVPEAVWNMQDFAHAVKRYLESHNLKSVFMVGHSFGGKTCIKLSSLFREVILKLVLINSSGIKPNRPFKKKIRIKYISFLRSVLKFVDRFIGTETFKNWFVPKFASPDYLNAGPMRAIFVKTVNEDLTDELSKINLPVLLLWGEKDTETPLEMGKRMHDLIKGSKLIVLPGMDHVPFLDSGMHVCAHHILKFFRARV